MGKLMRQGFSFQKIARKKNAVDVSSGNDGKKENEGEGANAPVALEFNFQQ